VKGRRHVVVTGAAGFVGRRLLSAILEDPAFADTTITANDLALVDTDPRIRKVPGDFRDPAVRARMIDGKVDVLFHVAGVLGGAAEADPALARAVNVDATLALLEDIKDPSNPPRLVFASSIAVFGTPFPPTIDDDTRLNPSMIYGAQKAMIEIAVEQASARGWVDGVAVRLPGIVVKPDADRNMKSAFLNRIFEVFPEGTDLTVPVSADGTTWLLSVPACIDALLHAASIDPARLGARRAFTLPAQNVRFSDLIVALRARFPTSGTRITFDPEPAIEAQFGRQPPLSTAIADALGFVHDGDVATLVARAL
jgi:nucleoside-diphosphate-sugar epimerase